jgi:uncharacterized repeat protein (TIGR01451 family)
MPTAGSSVSVKGYFESLDVNGTVVFTDSLINAATVTCSFDPNDKSVTPAGVQASNYTLMNDTLEYLIQFQNTGTDTAFTVVIRDTLDNNLDMNTFELIDASSPVQTQLSQLTRVVTFTFNTILLPDSNTNELLSHGFVRYRIRAIQGLPAATAITNTANIYFDFNSPVATNSTLNTLVYVIPSAIVETDKIAKHATVIPNPFDGKAWLVFSNPAKEIYQLHIFSVAGKQVMKKVFADDKLLLQKENLSSGLYIYELTNVKTGDKMRGKFVIQ